jgi:hypothetical protein
MRVGLNTYRARRRSRAVVFENPGVKIRRGKQKPVAISSTRCAEGDKDARVDFNSRGGV